MHDKRLVSIRQLLDLYKYSMSDMARKRSSAEIESAPIPTRPRRQSTKRARMAPEEEREGNSSATSNGSVSVDSALRSTPPGDQVERHRASGQSSVESSDAESESSDESESDESEASDEGMEEGEEGVETVRAQRKPDMNPAFGLGSAGSLQERLKSFLPKMKEANGLLGEEDTIEDVGEDEPHIEMNLGLGVLEEKGADAGETDEESEESEDFKNEDTKTRQKERDVMGKLTGDHDRQGGGIEEVE